MEAVVDRIGQLLSQLQTADFFERERAVRELGTFSNDDAVAGLVMALEDSDRGIRELSAEFLSGMRGEAVVQLLIRFLGHEDIGSRNLAAEIIVKIGEGAVRPLIENIADPDHDIRKFIVDILGMIGSKRAVDALCEALFDENVNVICSAAESLGRIGSALAIADLVAVFDNIPDAKLNVVEALGRIRSSTALPKLYEILKSDDPMLLHLSLEAIGNIGDPQSVGILKTYLEKEDRATAETALMAIINIGEAHGGRFEYDLPLQKFKSSLFEGVRLGDKTVTEFILNRLGSWSGSDVLESLLDALPAIDESYQPRIKDLLGQAGRPASRYILARFKDASVQTQELYLEVLRSIIDEEILDALIPQTDSAAPEIKQRLAHIFGWSDYAPAQDTLRSLTRDESGHVRSAAYAAIGWHASGADCLDILFRGLDDQYPDVREAAMGALIMIAGDEVVRRFTEDMYHENTERQRLAVKALGTIGASDVVPSLILALNHPDAAMRRSAIDALGRIRQMHDTQPLVQALGDEDGSVRKAAVTALRAIKGSDAIDEIKYLLDDEDVWVRCHTINAIGEIGDQAHAELIARFLDDEQDIIRIVTAKALALIGGREALDRLEDLRNDKNPDLAEAAELALASIRREIRT